MNGLTDFDLLTMAKVAALLHCSRAHVCNLIAGKVKGCSPLPAIRLGRRPLVRAETLRAWVEQNEAANDSLKPLPERGRKSA
jgi:excisionase family DNA binding protein